MRTESSAETEDDSTEEKEVAKDEAQYTEKEAETVEDSKEEKENAEKIVWFSRGHRKEVGKDRRKYKGVC